MSDFSLVNTKPCYDDILQAYKDILANLIITLQNASTDAEDRIANVKLSDNEIEFIVSVLEEKEDQLSDRFREDKK